MITNRNGEHISRFVDSEKKSHYRFDFSTYTWHEAVYDNQEHPVIANKYSYWTSDYNKIENAGTIDIHAFTQKEDGTVVLTSECNIDTICKGLSTVQQSLISSSSEYVTEYGELNIWYYFCL